MYERKSEIWSFPDSVKKVKLKINNLTVIGLPEKRPVEGVFTLTVPKSTRK